MNDHLSIIDDAMHDLIQLRKLIERGYISKEKASAAIMAASNELLMATIDLTLLNLQRPLTLFP